MTRSLTLLDSGLVDSGSLDRILQAVIFFADSIAVRASYEVAPGFGLTADEVEWKVSALREQGFIRLWAHEYEVDDGGYARNPYSDLSVRRHADLVIAQSDLGQSLGEMDEFMRAVREDAYRDSVERHGIRLRQGTAEIVGLRNQLSSLVISSELNQDGLLTNPAARSSLTKSFRSSNDSFKMSVVREVVSELRLGSLSGLTADQVEQCRRYGQGFRQLLDDSLLAVARGMDPILTPQAVAKELLARYRAISAEFVRPGISMEVGGEVFWDVLGATIPASMVLKYGLKALSWRKKAAEVRPFLLLMQLERSLRDQE